MLTFALVLSLAAAGSPTWEQLALPSGVRVSVLRIPEAARQATFTFLPISLLDDAPHRAQFAHLVEHMLIRSTDPDVLQVDGIQLNGETGATTARLETLAEPRKWKEALARHARWLTAREFDDEVLENEKLRIAEEEKSTTASGYTHKWAQAAWSQVVRCGLDHAAVHGDVAHATLEELRDYVRERLRVDASVTIVTVGPIAASEIRAVLEAELHDVKLQAPAKRSPPAAAAETARDRVATWDLARQHYVEWYPLPGDGIEARAAAQVIAQALTMSLIQDPALTRRGAHALAAADLTTERGRAVSISVSLAQGGDRKPVEAAVRDAIEALTGKQPSVDLAQVAVMIASSLDLPDDFAALRAQWKGRPGADLVEAQTVLSQVHLAMAAGAGVADLASALRALERSQLEEIARKTLAPAQRRTLWLEPVKQ